MKASQSTILPLGSVTLTATLKDDEGNPATAGITIDFNVSNSSLGDLNESSATTNDAGVATVTYTALDDTTGTVVFTASYDGETSNQAAVTIEEAASTLVPDAITFNIADNTIVMAGDNQVIYATLRDEDGKILGKDVAVTFSVDHSDLAVLSTYVNDTNASGFAQTMLTAKQDEGMVTLTAEAGGVVSSISLKIMRDQPATITFVDISQKILSVRGSGGVDDCMVTFLVKNGSGEPVTGEPVEIAIVKGPQGGEYLGAINESGDDTTSAEPTVTVFESLSDKNGIASVMFHSGYVAGPVTLQARIDIDGLTVLAQPTVLSIGGGVPADPWLQMAVGSFNLPGLNKVISMDVSLYMADRYSNYNILDGTQVNFYAEQGLAVSSTGTTNGQTGFATVSVRTQGKMYDVAKEDWEVSLIETITGKADPARQPYGHPTNGMLTIMASTSGTEYFYDGDSDGLYDGSDGSLDKFYKEEEINGEIVKQYIYDTLQEPFIDYDGDETFDEGEQYIDDNDSNLWDGKNGVCDTLKFLFRNTEIYVTGSPMLFYDDVVVPAGGYATMTFYICDYNYNPLSAGTSIKVAEEASFMGSSIDVFGSTETTIPHYAGVVHDKIMHLSRISFPVYIVDKRSEDDATRPGSAWIKVTINWEGEEFNYTVPITLQAS